MILNPLGERAIRRIAKKSDHRWAHHVAILVGEGRIVAVGYNKGVTHAEEMAVRKLKMSGGSAARLYSVRIRRDGKIGASKPCPNCESLLRDAGIRDVYYNDYDGKQERIRL